MLQNYIRNVEGYVPFEILLKEDDDFLKVKETLTRIGVQSKVSNTLWQSCHILHKKGRFFIVHFKELYALDGRQTNIEKNDIQRRNTIGKLLQDWGLVEALNKDLLLDLVPVSQIKIIPFRDKKDWTLEPKYMIGNKSYSKEYFVD